MILVDFSQVMISNLMAQLKEMNTELVDEDFLRHMILNSLRYYKSQFKKDFGKEMVICCDSRHYWRKDIFKFYKASRKKGRDDSNLDWDSIFSALNKIKAEIAEFFPYKVIEIEGAEADDVIGTISHNVRKGKILIVSGDKDFKQLQKYDNVSQYAPVQKEMLKVDDADQFLKEQILRGDDRDGIPNFLSDEDTFVTTKRQRQLSEEKVQKWTRMKPEFYCDDVMLDRYKMNQKLIDLTFTPEDIRVKILTEFEKPSNGSIPMVQKYFIKNKLVYLLDRIEEF